MTTRRAQPLTAAAPTSTAAGSDPAASPFPWPLTATTDADPGGTGDTSDRERRFAAGLRSLRVTGGLALGERTLMVVGGIIAPLGLLVILLGWYGAARSGHLFDQVPYLISGGLFGLGLVFLGAFFYFAHWLTELVREHRTQSAAVVAAIGDLADRLERLEANRTPGVNGTASAGPAAETWVATSRGALAHRPTCAAVVGKEDLRTLSPDEVTRRCQLCAPGDDS